ncbi:16359_t:CDS:2, partial [Gigaspora rosea]
ELDIENVLEKEDEAWETASTFLHHCHIGGFFVVGVAVGITYYIGAFSLS